MLLAGVDIACHFARKRGEGNAAVAERELAGRGGGVNGYVAALGSGFADIFLLDSVLLKGYLILTRIIIDVDVAVAGAVGNLEIYIKGLALLRLDIECQLVCGDEDIAVLDRLPDCGYV